MPQRTEQSITSVTIALDSQPLIFTDMDGTLLDHDDYSYQAALPLLQQLRQLSIPVIPTTSKTYAELLQLRQQLPLDGPFIVENGAAVMVPQRDFTTCPQGCVAQEEFWCKSLTQERYHWQQKLAQVEEEFAGLFRSFAHMSVTEIAQQTGLNQAQAKLAASRQYGEPVLWLGSSLQQQAFVQALIELGVTPLQGGRFIHICGKCDKGQALQWLAALYHTHFGANYISVALGDSQNDVAMLEQADIAVRIASRHHPFPQLQRQHSVLTSQGIGPIGWSECLSQILQPHLSPS